MATKTNIVIDQGTDYSTTIDVTDDDGVSIDLTGYSANAALRKHYASVNSHAFTVSVNASGSVTVSMTAAQTANIVAGRYVYDVKLISSGNVVSRLVEGLCTLRAQVTR